MGVNLEVAIPLIGSSGLGSSSAAVVTFQRTAYRFDEADYDGATYYFEIVGLNSNTNYDYDVSLYDQTNASVVATITIPKNTASTRYRSDSFSPAEGTVEYRVRVARTSAAGAQVKVTAARILVVQVDAEKTELVYPFLFAQSTVATYQDTGTPALDIESQTYDQYERIGLWRRTDSQLSTVEDDAWRLSAVMSPYSSGRTSYCALYDVAGNAVTGTELSATGSSAPVFYISSAFSSDATNFADATDYEVRMKNSDAYNGVIHRAELRVKVTDLSKAYVYKQIGPYKPAFTTAFEFLDFRSLHTSANWQSGYTVDFDATGYCNNTATALEVSQTNGDTGSATPIGASVLNWNSSTSKVRRRVTGISLTDGYTQIAEAEDPGSINQVVLGSFLVYNVTAEEEAEAQEATAVVVTHASSVYQAAGSPGVAGAVAQIKTHASSVFQASGVPGATSAVAVKVTHASGVSQAAGTPGALGGVAQKVTHASSVLQASGVPGATDAVAVLVTHASSVFSASGAPGAIGGVAQLVEHAPSVFQAAGAAVAASAVAVLVEHASAVLSASGTPGATGSVALLVESVPTVYEATGVSEGASAEALLVESTPGVFQAAGSPGAVTAEALFVEHAPVVNNAVGIAAQFGAAQLVEHEAAVFEASGVAGGAEAEALLVERTPVVFSGAGAGAALEGEAQLVTSTATVYNATGSASAKLVDHAPAVLNATGVPGATSAEAWFVSRSSSTYSASGSSGTVSALAQFVSRTPTVYPCAGSEIILVTLHGGKIQRVNWRATIRSAGWGAEVQSASWQATLEAEDWTATTEPSNWSAVTREDQ